MRSLKFKQVDVFTPRAELPFAGHPTIGGVTAYGASSDGRVSIRIEGGKIFLGGSAVTCIEGTLRHA